MTLKEAHELASLICEGISGVCAVVDSGRVIVCKPDDLLCALESGTKIFGFAVDRKTSPVLYLAAVTRAVHAHKGRSPRKARVKRAA